jgi:hypothetical protein
MLAMIICHSFKHNGADNLDKRRQPFGSELIRWFGILVVKPT